MSNEDAIPIVRDGRLLTWREIRLEVLALALRRHHGHVGRAADELGIAHKTAYNWLNRCLAPAETDRPAAVPPVVSQSSPG